MTKYNFLKELERRLSKLPESERQEILQDYEEHFTFAEEAGKSDSDVIKTLGNPAQIAKEMTADYHMEQVSEATTVSNVFSAVFAVGALGFFSLVFILGPAIAIFATIFALGVASLALVASPILLLMFSGIGLQSFTWFDFFASLTAAGMGIFMTMGTYYLIQWSTKLTAHYLAFSRRMMKGGKA